MWILTFSFLDYLPKSFRFDVCVDEWRERIHDENGERHALGVRTPVTYDDGEQSDAHSIDKLSLVCHGRGDIVGGHEDGAKHETTAEDGSHGVGIDGVGHVEQSAEDEDGGDDAHGDVPRDDLLPQHVSQSDEKGQGAHLANGTGAVRHVSKEHGHGVGQLVEARRVSCLDGRLHDA